MTSAPTAWRLGPLSSEFYSCSLWRKCSPALIRNTYDRTDGADLRVECEPSHSSRMHHASDRKGGERRRRLAAVCTALPQSRYRDEQDYIKAGGGDLPLVQLQASKQLVQPKIQQNLLPLAAGSDTLDLVVIGCGPAGLSIAAESAKRGLSVGLIGPDVPFVNNYGVWLDEFEGIGLAHCLDHTWRDAALYLDSDKAILVGREYGRVGRDLLRQELLNRCALAGVRYADAQVDGIDDSHSLISRVKCTNGLVVPCRLVTVAAGAASGRFLEYEEDDRDGRGVGVQTAYGIEVEVDSYPYDPSVMHFMDYRDLEGEAEKSSDSNVPTFLYAMPLSPTRVFFEETCLAARPAMSFGTLKERLHRRLSRLNIKYHTVHEEEWSYIPVGGALPDTYQRHVGFGAAASMIHPATGYSIARSLNEAPHFADSIARALSKPQQPSAVAALQAWNSLWSQERKRQRAFMVFGLELILQLNLSSTRDFFHTFFCLPEGLWKGFLGSNLTSMGLIQFALATFIIAPNSLRYLLVKHLLTDPSGASLVGTYLGLNSPQRRTLR